MATNTNADIKKLKIERESVLPIPHTDNFAVLLMCVHTELEIVLY